jgi:hypothetical protein
MRKIDKSVILSKEYHNWLKRLKTSHPKFSDSTTRRKHYLDVVMSLYFCQQGLCAYTEKDIFSDNHTLFLEISWDAGKYSLKMPKHIGEVEHFDSEKKKEQAWEWDNLFMVLGKANTEKSIKEIDERLKPDNHNYDPFTLLEYDVAKHIFIPNKVTFKTIEEQMIITQSILNLGINFVQGERIRFIKRILKQIELGVETWGSIEVREYPTAFEFYKQHFKNNFSST